MLQNPKKIKIFLGLGCEWGSAKFLKGSARFRKGSARSLKGSAARIKETEPFKNYCKHAKFAFRYVPLARQNVRDHEVYEWSMLKRLKTCKIGP